MAKITTRECSFAELRPELVEVTKGHMSNDEKPLICCETKYPNGGTSYYAHMVTQHRVIHAHSTVHGFLDQLSGSREYDTGVSSMLLTDIVSIEEYEHDKASGLGFVVHVKGHGDSSEHCTFESRQASLKFTRTLREAMEKAKAAAGQAQRSPADRLRELADLHRDGLIADAEFQQKRKEILGQL